MTSFSSPLIYTLLSYTPPPPTGLDLIVSLSSSIADLPQRLKPLIRSNPEGEVGMRGLVEVLKSDRRYHRGEYKAMIDSLAEVLPPEPKKRRVLVRGGTE